MKRLAWMTAALALSACAPDATTVNAEIQRAVRAYVTSNDLAASLEMMDEAATSITGDGTILRSRARIKEYASPHIAAIREQRISLGGIEVRSLVLAEGAVTVVVAKRDSGWKVVHSHYSYPSARRP